MLLHGDNAGQERVDPSQYAEFGQRIRRRCAPDSASILIISRRLSSDTWMMWQGLLTYRLCLALASTTIGKTGFCVSMFAYRRSYKPLLFPRYRMAPICRKAGTGGNLDMYIGCQYSVPATQACEESLLRRDLVREKASYSRFGL